jgi:hypothetical protein
MKMKNKREERDYVAFALASTLASDAARKFTAS